jgi:oligopeptide/dipeptide ABC transporter ATP-binding protein
MTPLLELADVAVHLGRARQDPPVRAVDGVDLRVDRGEILGLVGETGCGKSTLARAVTRLVPVTRGSIRFDGVDITDADGRAIRRLRRRIRIVLQDPYGSLNPRMAVGTIVSQPLRIHRTHGRREQRRRVDEVLELVGLPPSLRDRHPHELSGGQRQRVAIARALAPDPELLVLDEPVSALDVSIQAQILLLLRRLQGDLGISSLFISHDLAVVRHVAQRIGVMYLGTIVETGERDEVFTNPRHPYTRALLDAVPEADPARRRRPRVPVFGEPPDPTDPPSGCPFRPRCWKADERCAEVRPVLVGRAAHQVACHHPD